MRRTLLAAAGALALVFGCTQETQNQIGRSIQNWTGTNGVLDVYAGAVRPWIFLWTSVHTLV